MKLIYLLISLILLTVNASGEIPNAQHVISGPENMPEMYITLL